MPPVRGLPAANRSRRAMIPGMSHDRRMSRNLTRTPGGALAAILLMVAGCTLLPTRPTEPPREPTPAEQGIKPLTGAEVRALLGKAHYRWQAAQGASGTAITSGDGRVR